MAVELEMHMLSVDHLLSLRIFHSNLVYASSLSLRLLSNAFSMRWKQCSVIGQLLCSMDLELTSTCGGMRPASFFMSG